MSSSKGKTSLTANMKSATQALSAESLFGALEKLPAAVGITTPRVVKQPELKDIKGYLGTVRTKAADFCVTAQNGTDEILYKTPEPLLGTAAEAAFAACGCPLPKGTGRFVVRIVKVEYEADQLQQRAIRTVANKTFGLDVHSAQHYASVEGRVENRVDDKITAHDFALLARVAVTGDRNGTDKLTLQDIKAFTADTKAAFKAVKKFKKA